MGNQDKERNKTTPAVMCIKILLQIFNFLYLLVGIAVLVTGILVVFELSPIMELTGLYYANSAYVMIGVGVLILLVAVGGFYCTAKNKIAMLYMYAIFIGFVAILQLAAGILGGVYHKQVETTIHEGLEKHIDSDKSDIKKAWATVQKTFHCCGIDGPSDWLTSLSGTIPDSCITSVRRKRQAETSSPATITIPDSSIPFTSTSADVTTTQSTASVANESAFIIPALPASNVAETTTVLLTPTTTLENMPSATTTISGHAPTTANSDPSLDLSHYYTAGCSTKIMQTAEHYMAAIIGVCCGFIVFQILGTVLACCLAKKVGRNNYEQIY